MNEQEGSDERRQPVPADKRVWDKPVLERLSMRATRTTEANFATTDGTNNYS